MDSVAVTLNRDFNNTIRFAATGNDFGNLDEITIIPRALTPVELADDKYDIPADFRLHQNYPNPFNPQTTIAFDLPEASQVSMTIYDVNGRLVSELVDESYPAGLHEVIYDGKDLASGVYVIRSKMLSLNAKGGEYMFTQKMMCIK